MARILLITNPSDDRPTEYLGAWSERIVELAKKQPDTKIISLDRESANRKQLTYVVEKEKPQLIIFNGHGDNNCITGFGQEILVQCDDNVVLLKHKIIHSLSCNSGELLGPASIKIGALAYIGYREKFKLIHLNQETHQTRLEDSVANFFLAPAFEAVIALVEGSLTGEAYARSQKIYAENLRVLVTSKNTDYNTTVASQVYHNMIYQVCLGDNTTSF